MNAAELDHQALLQLEQEKMLLDDMLKRNDLTGSVQQYKRMRLIAQQLNDAEQARVAAEKLLRIHDIIADMLFQIFIFTCFQNL